MSAEQLFRDYLTKVDHAYRMGNATEHTYRPYLKDLLEALGNHITATNEPRRVACGAPDYVISREERTGHATIGYVEAKDIGVSLTETLKTDQLRRYLNALENLVLTDYLEFRWFLKGEQHMTVRLAEVKNGHVIADHEGIKKTEDLLVSFLGQSPELIRSPRDLAQRMARLTHMIRDLTVESFAQHTASTTLNDLYQSFQDVLIPELPESDFADMFAQTLAYGLFAARSRHLGPDFRRESAAREIPKTNPFLRRLFGAITGPDLDDEPFAGFVDDLTQLLARADMETILADFGHRTRQEDPIVHFYETFLTAYDPKLRELRGVYYTPEPVVSYIVRSVDAILKRDFGLADGLASDSPPSLGEGPGESAGRVLLLDPACGTGTFLYKVVDLIRERFQRAGNTGMWSGYVGKHLLPRLFGFELLMAPYAMAHLKLGMQLAALDMDEAQRRDWAYDFAGDERLGVYLTNTLDEAAKQTERLKLGQYISDEANEAATIKRDAPVMVVLGNPPYSNFGQTNTGDWIRGLLKDYKEGLNERKINLDDDFIKFIRFGQWRIERTGHGILAFITNNTYIDGITHRRMRQSLMGTFSDIYILNLHGSVKRREKTPEGAKDENVFDIQQGVAISIFVKKLSSPTTAVVHYADLWGNREGKYESLLETDVERVIWQELAPAEPGFYFVPRRSDLNDEYQSMVGVTSSFPVWSSGIQTKRDKVAVAETRERLLTTLNHFASRDVHLLRHEYDLPEDGRDWTIPWAAEHASQILKNNLPLDRVLYRPFDKRWTVIDDTSKGIVAYPRYGVMRHFKQNNVGLIVTRQLSLDSYQHVWVTTDAIDGNTISLQTREYNYVFPLYLYPDTSKASLWDEAHPLPNTPGGRSPNLAQGFVDDLKERLRLAWVADGKGSREVGTFGPEDVFDYMYAIFHSPEYRERYAEFLKTDFPRLPLTRDVALFWSLSDLGDQLVKLHLMERHAPAITRYPVKGDDTVEKVRYTAPGEDASASPPSLGEGPGERAGRVWINATQYFEGVPPEVWEFHVGGYQVCEKWLKDRKGRTLTYDDLTHYQQTVAALAETIRLMAAIDETIEDHGGWPLDGERS